MKQPSYLAMLCVVLFTPLSLIAQCGNDPVSGTFIISSPFTIANSYFPGVSTVSVGQFTLSTGVIDNRGSAAPLTTGDLVVIMQMQGADYNSSNSDSYGNGVAGADASGYLSTNLKAGKYEYNTVASVSGALVTFTNAFMNDYAARNFSSGTIQTYQVIRVPRNYNLTIAAGSIVTSPPWNGETGGVVILDASNTLNISGSINVNGLGFRGGGGIQMNGAISGNSNGSGVLTNSDFRWNSPQTTAANLSGGAKGEGICGTPVYIYYNGTIITVTNTFEGYNNGSMGRGAPGNAGGGSTDGSPVGANTENQYNSGGGGGANGGSGGKGGSGWHGGSGSLLTFPTGGFGAALFSERQATQFIMGGGGGAGSANNSNGANQYMSSGGTGGGIILLRAAFFAGNGVLQAEGSDAPGVTGSGGNTDAAGGGGAGGTIVAITRTSGPTGLGAIGASVKGGNGGNMDTHFDHGPGGGGGGGVIITNGTFSTTNIAGGSNGFTRAGNTTNPVTNSYGAIAGSNGVLLTISTAPQAVNSLHAPVACSTLPIHLISFSGTKNNGNNLLYWQVSDAVDFSRFEIEYSSHGNHFSTAGNVSFQSQQQAYQFTHSAAGDCFYRLKLIDQNGSFSYSKTLVIKEYINISTIRLFPQPANDVINVQINALKPQPAAVYIYNVGGSLINEMKLALHTGNNSFVIDQLSDLAAGHYTMTMLIDGKMQYAKFIVQHP